MITSHDDRRASHRVAALEAPLAAVENGLNALSMALHRQDAPAVERVAAELHTALAAAVDHFGRAAKSGGVPPGMRRRLALAGGQVAAQREALARATASLDRAIDVLLPRLPAQPARYSAGGSRSRPVSQGGSLLA